MVLISSKLATD